MDGLDRARRDLAHAHALIQLLEQQRNGAEDEARDAKALAVQMQAEREVVIAREAGRRQGILEGLSRARAAESIHVDNTERAREEQEEEDDDDDDDDLYADEAPSPRQQSPERVAMPEPSVHAPSPPPPPQPVYTQPSPLPAPPVPIFDTQPPANFPVPVPAPAPAVQLSTIQEDANEPILNVPPPSRSRSRRDSETGSSASISQFDILHNRASASTSRPGTSHSRRAPDAMPTPVPMPQVPRHYPSYTTLNMPISSRDAGFDPDSPTRKTLSPEDSDSDDDDDESNDNYTVTVQGPVSFFSCFWSCELGN